MAVPFLQSLQFVHESIKDIQLKKHGMRESGVSVELKTGESVGPLRTWPQPALCQPSRQGSSSRVPSAGTYFV
jgi:hypothetical protein